MGTEKSLLAPKEVTEFTRLKFGVHKDSELRDVPASYLLWCFDEDWFKKKYPAICDWIEDNHDDLLARKDDEKD